MAHPYTLFKVVPSSYKLTVLEPLDFQELTKMLDESLREISRRNRCCVGAKKYDALVKQSGRMARAKRKASKVI